MIKKKPPMKSKLFEFGLDTTKILVVGDLHGDLKTYNAIVESWRKEPDAHLIFLGDYADRGSQGLEILESLMNLAESPRVVLLRGNHEDYFPDGKPQFSPCDLILEVEAKRGNWKKYFGDCLSTFFNQLYDAAILPSEILFVHGGISTANDGRVQERQGSCWYYRTGLTPILKGMVSKLWYTADKNYFPFPQLPDPTPK